MKATIKKQAGGHYLPLILSVIILSVLLSIFFTSSSTSATSDWDDLIKPVTSLEVTRPDGSDVQSITFSYIRIMKNTCDSATFSSFSQAINDPDNGSWQAVQSTNNTRKSIVVGWTRSQEYTTGWGYWGWSSSGNHTGLYATFNGPYRHHPSTGRVIIERVLNGDFNCRVVDHTFQGLVFAEEFYDGRNTSYQPFFSSFDITYPTGYDGVLVQSGSAIDNDGDGLNLIQEARQETSDNNVDSDGDGINDFKESAWFPDRDIVFCNTSTISYACSYPDPTVKDIYIEIDWMQNSSRSLKPSVIQKSLVAGGLDDKGYSVHIDTGEYGGGNALPYITNLDFAPSATETDYFDLKNGDTINNISANFDPARKGIWRYVISGYNYDESPESSGAAFAGSDNVFVSYGMIEDNPFRYDYTDFDTAVAGTTVHELGHSLCLSESQKYSFQDTNCIFSGVDQKDLTLTYDSVMNYSLQMYQTHLSSGNNGTGDHDDWTAIDNEGVADFSRWTMDDISASGATAIRPGITIKQAQDAKKKGVLGKIKRGNKIYDYREKKIHNIKTGSVTRLKP